MAKLIESEFKNSDIKIKLCSLNTVFDKAYDQLEDCLKQLSTPPLMILSLGETGCHLKLETMVKNYDQTFGPDNEGQEREGEIISGGQIIYGLRYPLPLMYCSLSREEKEKVIISKNAGSFVCNNTAYQFSHRYPESVFGLIHVPSSSCWRLKKKNEESLIILKKMISSAVSYLNKNLTSQDKLPHQFNSIRLPVLKKEMREYKTFYQNKNPCLEEFFTLTPAFDE